MWAVGYVWKDSRATSAMMDVLIDEQELPEPVRLRAIQPIRAHLSKYTTNK